jgi:cell fate (sporulation/competence/biofilm development) regulator YmcA (YheA/YmcA/DUF963 family)
MDLKDAYDQLKKANKEYHIAVNCEQRAKPRAKKQFHEEAKRIENDVWNIFQSCPVLYEYVPYKGEFFTSFFERDFDVLMDTLDNMKL